MALHQESLRWCTIKGAASAGRMAVAFDNDRTGRVRLVHKHDELASTSSGSTPSLSTGTSTSRPRSCMSSRGGQCPAVGVWAAGSRGGRVGGEPQTGDTQPEACGFGLRAGGPRQDVVAARIANQATLLRRHGDAEACLWADGGRRSVGRDRLWARPRCRLPDSSNRNTPALPAGLQIAAGRADLGRRREGPKIGVSGRLSGSLET